MSVVLFGSILGSTAFTNFSSKRGFFKREWCLPSRRSHLAFGSPIFSVIEIPFISVHFYFVLWCDSRCLYMWLVLIALMSLYSSFPTIPASLSQSVAAFRRLTDGKRLDHGTRNPLFATFPESSFICYKGKVKAQNLLGKSREHSILNARRWVIIVWKTRAKFRGKHIVVKSWRQSFS